MHHFAYRDSEMFCEDVPIRAIARRTGTPVYVYSHATLRRHFLNFDRAFDGLDRLVCFSAKANSNLAVLRLFAGLGGGLDIVSGGELFRGLKAGFDPEKIVYSGVGKRVDEIDDALGAGILLFNVESMEELRRIDERAGALGKTAPVAIRVNPDVDPKTHPYISTGMKKNKFGIDTRTALEGYQAAMGMRHIDVKGVDCHIGSQITDVQPFADAMKSLLDLIGELRRLGVAIRCLDMGGGLGITYNSETPPQPGDYARVIVDALKQEPLRLILEPGRVIVGNAGVLVTRVLYRKAGPTKNFVITDAAMNDLMRPALYQAYHAIEPVVKSNAARSIVADVVGPICESSDFLALDRQMADVRAGDLLAVMSAGAYGFTMASNYCSRLRAAEVMVKGGRFEVVKARETYDDLMAGETVPDFLQDN